MEFREDDEYLTEYICLDTINSLSSDRKNYFTWNYTFNRMLAKGSINTVNEVMNIYGIRFYPMTLYAGSQTNNTLNSDMFINNSISVLISEFSPQSFKSIEGNLFHHISNYTINTKVISPGNSIVNITTTPLLNNKGYFWFQKPINQFSKLTISFYNPFQLITFIPNYLSAVVIQNSNPMQLTFNVLHNMLSNFKILINNFTTGNPISDKLLIDSINDQTLNVTKIDDYNITVPIDLTSMTPLLNPLTIFINIETIRNIIPIQVFYKKSII
jgi:hypothetical protein